MAVHAKQRMFFSEEKNQKTFKSIYRGDVRDLAGTVEPVEAGSAVKPAR